MTLDSDALVARRRLRRRVRVWQLVALVLAVAVVAVAARHAGLPFQRDHVGRLVVDGLILVDAARDAALAEAARDRAVKALIVHIDSPGGTVVGGEDLFNALRAVAANKPVATVMGTFATSAGYMTAVAGDRVFARASTLTGSIGVIVQATEVTGLLDRLGIRTQAIKSGPLKATPSPLEPLDEAGRAAAQALIDDSFAFFVDLVAARRPLERAGVRALADGRVFTGRQAVANGLVDAIGTEAAARDWLAAEHGIDRALPVRDIAVDRPSGLLARLAGSLSGKSLFSHTIALDGLVSVWHARLR